MTYVSKDAQGNITGVFANPQPDALDDNGKVICTGIETVLMDDNDPAVIAFLNPPKRPPAPSVDAIVSAIRATDGPLAQALNTALATSNG